MRFMADGMLAVNESGAVVGWSLILIISLLMIFAGVAFLRRWLLGSQASSTTVGFTLPQLREMHRRGELNTEEFERAKGKLMQSMDRRVP